MKLYFSGIRSSGTTHEQVEMLESAKVKHYLLDWFDLMAIGHLIPTGINIALDSGAYKNWGKSIDVDDYLQFIEGSQFRFDFVTAPDVIGDIGATLTNWEKVKRRTHIPWLPVWGWGAKKDLLLKYLDEAAIVGIGGLVPLMREGTREKSDAAKEMLDYLVALCQEFPQRFHIFGVNWLKAIESVRGLAKSGDTSKWLSGARHAEVIFINTRTNRLSRAPSKSIPQYSHLDRKGRCILCATTLNQYCNDTATKPMLKITFRPDCITVEIPNYGDDPKHQKIATMLEKANFQPKLHNAWGRYDDLEKWYEQCALLVSKVGGEIIDERQTRDDNIVVAESPPDLEARVRELELEVKRLGEQDAIASNKLQALKQQLEDLLR